MFLKFYTFSNITQMKILLTFWNLEDAPHPQHPWTAPHCCKFSWFSIFKNIKNASLFKEIGFMNVKMILVNFKLRIINFIMGIIPLPIIKTIPYLKLIILKLELINSILKSTICNLKLKMYSSK